MDQNILNFSFIIPGVLAGMAKPGRVSPLADDLALLHGWGIRAIVSLTEDPLPEQTVRGKGFAVLHLPVPDFTAPSLEQITSCVEFIDRMRAAGKPVAVHCYAGLGRTGALLACYLVTEGFSAADAVSRIRDLRPDSVQTESQLRQVYLFEENVPGTRGASS